MRVHLKGIVLLIWIVRKRIVVSSLRLSRYQFFLSTELQQRSLQKLPSSYDGLSLNRVNSSVIPQSKWNQSVADGCNERHFILVLDMKQQKKKDKERKQRNKKLIFWRRFWYDLSIMTLQRRLNAVVYKNNFPVAINCHKVSTIPYSFFLSNICFCCFAACFFFADWFLF